MNKNQASFPMDLYFAYPERLPAGTMACHSCQVLLPLSEKQEHQAWHKIRGYSATMTETTGTYRILVSPIP